MGDLAKDPLTMSDDELNKLKKCDLICAIRRLKDSRASSCPDTPAVQAVLSLVKPLLSECTQALHAEIQELRLHVTSLQDQLKQCMLQSPLPCNDKDSTGKPSMSFADAVRKTMKETLDDQDNKAEVIISGVNDVGKDVEFMTELCEKMKQSSLPKQVSRIGQKQQAKNRLMKVKFHSEFDARTFKVRYEEVKGNENVPQVRIRPSKTKSEQETYKKMREINKKLNDNAKSENANHSFSLRDDCTIWKFVQEDGRWKRDKSWTLPSEAQSATGSSSASLSPVPGNGKASPSAHRNRSSSS